MTCMPINDPEGQTCRLACLALGRQARGIHSFFQWSIAQCLTDCVLLMQAAMRAKLGPLAVPLLYFLYSDGSQVITIGDGYCFHRVILYLGFDVGTSRAHFGYRVIGWIPVVNKRAMHASAEEKKTEE